MSSKGSAPSTNPSTSSQIRRCTTDAGMSGSPGQQGFLHLVRFPQFPGIGRGRHFLLGEGQFGFVQAGVLQARVIAPRNLIISSSSLLESWLHYPFRRPKFRVPINASCQLSRPRIQPPLSKQNRASQLPWAGAAAAPEHKPSPNTEDQDHAGSRNQEQGPDHDHWPPCSLDQAATGLYVLRPPFRHGPDPSRRRPGRRPRHSPARCPRSRPSAQADCPHRAPAW